jgi:ferrous iron transport protein A
MGEAVLEQSQIRPLSVVTTGDTVRLVCVRAGRGLNSRLASMGFVPDARIRVVSNGHPGPFVIIIKDIKMVLGRGVAQKVFIR